MLGITYANRQIPKLERRFRLHRLWFLLRLQVIFEDSGKGCKACFGRFEMTASDVGVVHHYSLQICMAEAAVGQVRRHHHRALQNTVIKNSFVSMDLQQICLWHDAMGEVCKAQVGALKASSSERASLEGGMTQIYKAQVEP